MPGFHKKDASDKDDTEGKLFVGGIGWDSDEHSMKEYFETFGPVAYVKLKRNREDPSKHRGFAFVKFVNATDADAVLSHKEPHFVDGFKIDPKSACPLGVKPEERTRKVFVGGLQAQTTEATLMEYFSQFGEISSKIDFAIDRNTNKKRGFCFIEFANEGIVDRIVRTKFHQVAGKRLETKRALSKQQQQQQRLQQQQHIASICGQTFCGEGVGQLSSPILPHPYHMTPYGPIIYIHPNTLATLPYMGIHAPMLEEYLPSSMENLCMHYNNGQSDLTNNQINQGNAGFQTTCVTKTP